MTAKERLVHDLTDIYDRIGSVTATGPQLVALSAILEDLEAMLTRIDPLDGRCFAGMATPKRG